MEKMTDEEKKKWFYDDAVACVAFVNSIIDDFYCENDRRREKAYGYISENLGTLSGHLEKLFIFHYGKKFKKDATKLSNAYIKEREEDYPEEENE